MTPDPATLRAVLDPPPGRPHPCQGPASDCSWWAAVPFGRCPECAAWSRRPTIADVLCSAPRLDALPLPPDVVPAREAWMESRTWAATAPGRSPPPPRSRDR